MICAICGLESASLSTELCPHHDCVYGDNWSQSNRIQCDFFHRKILHSELQYINDEDRYSINDIRILIEC